MTAVTAHPPKQPIRAGETLANDAFAHLRQKMALEGCKWDPQVGDVKVLTPFPLLLQQSVWRQLAKWAEQMTREALEAEQEILTRPDLLGKLGIPRPIQRELNKLIAEPPTPAAARILRFDFHHTTAGWRISEANSDVPGGFCESSAFTALMAGHFPEIPSGDPAHTWVSTLANCAGPGGNIALLSAHRHMEDQQITAYLARQLHAVGISTHLAHPRQISWENGCAHLYTAHYHGPLDLLVRFYPADWLARRPSPAGWQHFFCRSKTPCANPGYSLISESKRFPLVWNQLRTQLPVWRKLLPETRDPRERPWQNEEGWLLKAAFGDTGETICMQTPAAHKDWAAATRAAWWHPQDWVAQRRFDDLPVETPLGPMRVCVGVYTINGQAAGIYARMTNRSHIDFGARDVAVLLTNE